jgi:hypothetical protein
VVRADPAANPAHPASTASSAALLPNSPLPARQPAEVALPAPPPADNACNGTSPSPPTIADLRATPLAITPVGSVGPRLPSRPDSEDKSSAKRTARGQSVVGWFARGLKKDKDSRGRGDSTRSKPSAPTGGEASPLPDPAPGPESYTVPNGLSAAGEGTREPLASAFGHANEQTLLSDGHREPAAAAGTANNRGREREGTCEKIDDPRLASAGEGEGEGERGEEGGNAGADKSAKEMKEMLSFADVEQLTGACACVRVRVCVCVYVRVCVCLTIDYIYLLVCVPVCVRKERDKQRVTCYAFT